MNKEEPAPEPASDAPNTLSTLAKVSTQQGEDIGDLKASAIEDDLESNNEKNAATTITNSSQEEEDNDKKDKKKKKGKAEKPPAVSVYQLFRFHIAHERLMLIAATIGSIYTGAIMPVSIIIFGQFISNLTGNLTDANVLLEATRPVILILVYLGTSVFFAAYMANSFWILTGENATRRIRSLYLHSILRQDLGWFDKAGEGSLTTRLAADTQTIEDGISEKMGLLIMCLAQFVSGYVIAFVKGWKMALVMLATVPLMLGTGILMGKYIKKFTLKVQDSYADAGSIAEQVFAGLRTVYSFSLQERFAARFEKELVKAEAVGIKRGMVQGAGFAVFMFVMFATYSLAFWFGSRLVRWGEMDGSQVLVVFFGMMMGSMALLQLPPNLVAVSSAMGAAYRIYNTIDRIPEIDVDGTQGVKPEKLTGDIEFKNIAFHYPTRPDIPILKDLSLKIHPGMTVAFVGSSGSGKSTSIQLVQRFYDPIRGQVLLDGRDIKTLDVKWLRQNIGVVSQEPVLFNMTIRQNLLMGVADPEKITQQEIEEACKRANCHTFICQLPDGYDTMVGEHGGMLSGGQKQRVAIARAILKNPTILLLDEATSALDTQSERLVQHALDEASKDRTTIVIAHRLSTIRDADLIVVMSQGDLVERGTHAELIKQGGVYADLVKKQEIATEQEKQEGVDDDVAPEDLETAELRQMDTKDSSVINMKRRRSSAASGPDAFELKLRREKELKESLKKSKAPISKVLRHMRPEWRYMFFGTLGAILAGAVFPIYGFTFSQVIVILTDPTKKAEIDVGGIDGTNLYAFVFTMIAIAAFLGYGAQNYFFELAGERYTKRLRGQLLRAYMRQEVGFFDQEDNNLGALTTKLAVDAKNVNELVTKVWGDFLQVIVTCITGLVIAFVYSWLLTLIILCMSPFIVIAAGSESRIRQGFADNTKRANAQSGEVAGEAIKEIRTVAALNKQEYFETRYYKATEYSHKLARRKAFLASVGYAMFRAITMYTQALAFYAGVRLIQDNWIDFQQMFTAMMAVMVTANNVGRGSVFTSTYVKAKFSAISTFEVLEREPLIDPDLEGIEVDRVEGSAQFQDINFAYPARPDHPIFKGKFNLDIAPNQSVALVGPSGCGKSTTIGMLLRWYDPQSGTVRLDNHSVPSYDLHNLRRHIAWVGQEPVLFDMSIGENIRYGLPDDVEVTQEMVEEAAKAANIHAFIEGLSDGYDTRVGDKGSQLSGGQKQRIAIARAWIRKPKVLLLDEATSALDSESEKTVQAALDNVISEGGRTTITIAHRLSTIQNADLICVVKHGKIIEHGTHWELLKLNGVYADLVRQQSLTVL